MIYGLFANNKPNRLGSITNEYYWLFKNPPDGYPGKVGKGFSFFPNFFPLCQGNLQNQDLFPKNFQKCISLKKRIWRGFCFSAAEAKDHSFIAANEELKGERAVDARSNRHVG